MFATSDYIWMLLMIVRFSGISFGVAEICWVLLLDVLPF